MDSSHHLPSVVVLSDMQWEHEHAQGALELSFVSRYQCACLDRRAALQPMLSRTPGCSRTKADQMAESRYDVSINSTSGFWQTRIWLNFVFVFIVVDTSASYARNKKGKNLWKSTSGVPETLPTSATEQISYNYEAAWSVCQTLALLFDVLDSAPFKVLENVVTDKKLLKDMGKLTQFCHTGNLEVGFSHRTFCCYLSITQSIVGLRYSNVSINETF